MKFSHSYLGYDDHRWSDTYNCTITSDDNQYVGYCKYYRPTCDSTIYIEYINIKESYQRQGYATATVIELMKKHNLSWDYQFTKLGRLWYDGMIKKGVILT